MAVCTTIRGLNETWKRREHHNGHFSPACYHLVSRWCKTYYVTTLGVADTVLHMPFNQPFQPGSFASCTTRLEWHWSLAAQEVTQSRMCQWWVVCSQLLLEGGVMCSCANHCSIVAAVLGSQGSGECCNHCCSIGVAQSVRLCTCK